MLKLVRNEAAVVKKTIIKKKKPHILAQSFGWYGALALMMGFLLVSTKAIKPDSLTYQLLNLSGALSLIVLGFDRHVRQTIVVNIFWATVAMIALFNLVF